jgi:hypothetical protein
MGFGDDERLLVVGTGGRFKLLLVRYSVVLLPVRPEMGR